ncbi:S8 family serine peptidase [Streptomyces sp. NPDC088358]|uniref:S8 family serine peptidase n=1 Tax=Streptomyces sp. NPDC088358 TaxID=3365857 RepID=UPI0037F9DDA9
MDHGSLVFAAVGNSGDKGNTVEYPAATPGVVGVAAVGKNLRRTSWSQYGSQVDISAPGEDMIHACGGQTGLCQGSGTSDATALASASAALIWSKHLTWTNNQVLRVMLDTAGGPTDGAKRNDSINYGIVCPRIALRNPAIRAQPMPFRSRTSRPRHRPLTVLLPPRNLPPKRRATARQPKPPPTARTAASFGSRWALVPSSSAEPQRPPSSANAGEPVAGE